MTQVEDAGDTPQPPITDRSQWLAARLRLLSLEKELTRRNDELTELRRALPWTPITDSYSFATEHGPAALLDLFGDRSQLIVYHFMYGPEWDEGCPSCSAVADGFNQTEVHLRNHDVSFWAVSRAPLDKLLAYRKRMSWSFPWASSAGSSFNVDFGATYTVDHVNADDGVSYNFGPLPDWLQDPANLPAEAPGVSVFARRGDDVFLTYAAFARGLDALWNMWQWLDRTPMGRNEGDYSWFARRDQYHHQPTARD